MSAAQFRLLAVCSWLLALCFAMAGAAALEHYFLFSGGPLVHATVTEIRPREDSVSIGLRYLDEGQVRDGWTSVSALDGLAVGADVEVLLHQNNREPILASDLGDQLPSIFVVLGFLASVAGGVALWVLPARAAARQRAARKSRLDAVIDAARRTRNQRLGGGVMLIGLGVLIGGVPLVDDSAGTGGSIFLGLLGLVSAAAGVHSIVRGIAMWDPTKNELIELIVRRPEDIAWVYVHRITTNGIQASEALAIFLWQANGKSSQLTMVREDLDQVLAEIAERAPHAQQGYDREIERLYRERPDRWRPTANAA